MEEQQRILRAKEQERLEQQRLRLGEVSSVAGADAAVPECAVTTTVALVTPGMARAAVSAALRTGSIAGPRCAGTSKAKLMFDCFMLIAVTMPRSTTERP